MTTPKAERIKAKLSGGETTVHAIGMTFDEYVRPPARPNRSAGGRWALGADYARCPNPVRTFENDARDGRALDASRRAYEKAAEVIAELDVSQSPYAPVRRVRRRSDYGDEVIVNRAINGDVDCWWHRERERRPRFITFGLNIARSCGVPHEQFAVAIGAAVAIIERLEAAGYSVRVVVHDSRHNWTGRGWYQLTHLVAKDYREPVDVERLLSIGSPGFFRWFGFSWQDEIAKQHRLTVGAGRGTPYPSDMREMIREYLGIDVEITADGYGQIGPTVETIDKDVRSWIENTSNGGGE